MTAGELAANLELLGWSPAYLARRLVIHPRSVERYWLTERRAIPKPVADWLRTLVAFQRHHAEFYRLHWLPAGWQPDTEPDDP